jgi:hypothetical protein
MRNNVISYIDIFTSAVSPNTARETVDMNSSLKVLKYSASPIIVSAVQVEDETAISVNAAVYNHFPPTE